MTLFEPIQTLNFIPESYFPNAPYLPSHFLPQQQMISLSELSLETDRLGQSSIINLTIDSDILIPYIDLSKYDSETKDWFWFDDDQNLPYRFKKSTNTLENIYPSEYSGLFLVSQPSFDKTNLRLGASFQDSEGAIISCHKYSPLLLVVEEKAYNDLSDYSLFISSSRLNKIDTTISEYYYDFNSRVYSNKNLAGINSSQVKLYYYKICDNSVSVKCRLSSNTGSETHYTPIVNHYITKLKGQSLRV